MAETFIPLLVSQPAASPLSLQTAVPRWHSVKVVARHQLGASVTDVAFNPKSPHDVAAASGFSVALVGSRAGTLRRTLARFKHVAHSAHFKPDGRLLVAGDAGGAARVFDLGSRAVLRSFSGHDG